MFGWCMESEVHTPTQPWGHFISTSLESINHAQAISSHHSCYLEKKIAVCKVLAPTKMSSWTLAVLQSLIDCYNRNFVTVAGQHMGWNAEVQRQSFAWERKLMVCFLSSCGQRVFGQEKSTTSFEKYLHLFTSHDLLESLPFTTN